ncbi:MAG: hypothetical protein ACFCGT_27185 [Sandaracinaceae bacterium]
MADDSTTRLSDLPEPIRGHAEQTRSVLVERGIGAREAETAALRMAAYWAYERIPHHRHNGCLAWGEDGSDVGES